MADELFEATRIEIDYAIVDRETLAIRPIADSLPGPAAADLPGSIGCTRAIASHVVTLAAIRPGPSRSALVADFQSAVRALDARLGTHGAMLLPGGMHPFMDFSIGTPNAQSVRLDLPFRDDFELERLSAATRAVLPLVPALAASSPIADGEPTGWLDTRLERDRELFGAVHHSGRNAIELRVQDVSECPAADLAIAEAVIAAVQALYHEQLSSYADQRRLPAPELASLLRDVARCGERAVVSDSRLLAVLGFPGRAADEPKAGDVWKHLIDATLGDAAEHLLTRARLDVIQREGPLARRILAQAAASTKRDAYSRLATALSEGRMLRTRD